MGNEVRRRMPEGKKTTHQLDERVVESSSASPLAMAGYANAPAIGSPVVSGCRGRRLRQVVVDSSLSDLIGAKIYGGRERIRISTHFEMIDGWKPSPPAVRVAVATSNQDELRSVEPSEGQKHFFLSRGSCAFARRLRRDETESRPTA
jgi:hypothetical protein